VAGGHEDGGEGARGGDGEIVRGLEVIGGEVGGDGVGFGAQVDAEEGVGRDAAVGVQCDVEARAEPVEDCCGEVLRALRRGISWPTLSTKSSPSTQTGLVGLVRY